MRRAFLPFRTPVADLGEGPGGTVPPLFLDQTGAQRAEKNVFGDCSPQAYFMVWMTGSPPLSQGLDPALHSPPFISFLFVHIYVYVIIN